MLLTCANQIDAQGRYFTRSPRVAFSTDGEVWTTPVKCLAEDHWLWRVTWHDDIGYSVSKLGIGNNPRCASCRKATWSRSSAPTGSGSVPRRTWTGTSPASNRVSGAPELLWMSYYSSHEGKSSIYLARLRLDSGRGADLRGQ